MDEMPIQANDAKPLVPLVDSRACQVGRPERITRRYDSANAGVKRQQSATHYNELKGVLFSIIANGAHPYTLSDFFAKAVQKGLPIDSDALFAPPEVLAMEARYMALLIPTLSSLHRDCREWIGHKLKKPPESIQGSFAWNAALGGTAIVKET